VKSGDGVVTVKNVEWLKQYTNIIDDDQNKKRIPGASPLSPNNLKLKAGTSVEPTILHQRVTRIGT
jgi:hypothetical protein